MSSVDGVCGVFGVLMELWGVGSWAVGSWMVREFRGRRSFASTFLACGSGRIGLPAAQASRTGKMGRARSSKTRTCGVMEGQRAAM